MAQCFFFFFARDGQTGIPQSGETNCKVRREANAWVWTTRHTPGGISRAICADYQLEFRCISRASIRSRLVSMVLRGVGGGGSCGGHIVRAGSGPYTEWWSDCIKERVDVRITRHLR